MKRRREDKLKEKRVWNRRDTLVMERKYRAGKNE